MRRLLFVAATIAALTAASVAVADGIEGAKTAKSVTGTFSATQAMRLVIPSGTLILLGFQTASSGFFISVLEIRATRSPPGVITQMPPGPVQ